MNNFYPLDQISYLYDLFAASPLNMSLEEKMEVDNRSIYVGNVDYGATAEELEQHFHGCGSINRVTILCNKFDGHPKGFAYIEFGDRDSVQTAMAMDESLFRGRQIKVSGKKFVLRINNIQLISLIFIKIPASIVF